MPLPHGLPEVTELSISTFHTLSERLSEIESAVDDLTTYWQRREVERWDENESYTRLDHRFLGIPIPVLRGDRNTVGGRLFVIEDHSDKDAVFDLKETYPMVFNKELAKRIIAAERRFGEDAQTSAFIPTSEHTFVKDDAIERRLRLELDIHLFESIEWLGADVIAITPQPHEKPTLQEYMYEIIKHYPHLRQVDEILFYHYRPIYGTVYKTYWKWRRSTDQAEKDTLREKLRELMEDYTKWPERGWFAQYDRAFNMAVELGEHPEFI